MHTSLINRVVIVIMVLSHHQNWLQSWNVRNSQEFIEKHLLPEGPVKDVLDKTFKPYQEVELAFRWAGCEFLRNYGKIVVIHPSIPGYVIKAINYEHETIFDKIIRTFHRNRNVCRVYINEQIQKCIQANNLKHVITPKKYLYHIPGRPNELDDANYIVIAERMNVLCKQCNQHVFARHSIEEQRREVITVIRAIGYGDSYLDNICFLKNGKIAFIDTEPHGTVDFLSYLPGFDKAVFAISANIGEDIFQKQCRDKKKESPRYKTRSTHDEDDAFFCCLCSPLDEHRFISGCNCLRDPYLDYFFNPSPAN